MHGNIFLPHFHAAMTHSTTTPSFTASEFHFLQFYLKNNKNETKAKWRNTRKHHFEDFLGSVKWKWNETLNKVKTSSISCGWDEHKIARVPNCRSSFRFLPAIVFLHDEKAAALKWIFWGWNYFDGKLSDTKLCREQRLTTQLYIKDGTVT